MKEIGVKILIGLLVIIASVPLGLLYILSDISYVIIYHLWGYRRELVRKNLRRSFPEYTDKELLMIEHKF